MNVRLRLVLSAVSAGALLLSAQAASANQAEDGAAPERRFFHCSYSAQPNGYWAAVETAVRYEELLRQWKAFAEKDGGTRAFCFSRFRKDDPAYQSLDEVEAVGRLSPQSRRVDWAPKERSAPQAHSRAADEADYQVAMKKYQEELAEQEAAVARFKAETARIEAEKAAQIARAKAAEEAYAAQKAAHDAEIERFRRARDEYEAKIADDPAQQDPQ